MNRYIPPHETLDFDVVATRATEKALLVEIDGDEVWVPLSVIGRDSEVRREGDRGTLTVKKWWAVKNELAEDAKETE